MSARSEGDLCWAGRWAFNEGAWRKPCPDLMQERHLVTDPDDARAARIWLCRRHYQQVFAQGLVTTPDPSQTELAAFKARLDGKVAWKFEGER